MVTRELREASAPAQGGARPEMSLCSALADRLAAGADSVFVERKDGLGGFRPVTVGQFAQDVVDVARGLVSLGVGAGDHVGLMAATRYEWTLLDFAILHAAAVPVPIYPTDSPEQVRWIVRDARLRVVIVENPLMAEAVAPLIDSGEVDRVLVIDEGAVAALVERGREVPESRVRELAALARMDTLATIVYTSGTTGPPKGVELTHGNFLEHALNGARDPHLSVIIGGQATRTLLFLPLAHVFARYIVVVALVSGTVLGYAPSTATLLADLKAFRPTWLLVVPRVLEKVYNSADLRAGTGARRRIFRWAAHIARLYSESLDHGGPSPWLRSRHALADRLVFRTIREVMGGQVVYAISGGAPLSTRLGHFFRGLGLTVMEGYGLTELAAPTTVNLPGLFKIGSVGPPFPGTRIRIDDDGEILVQGPNMFRGYHNNPAATAEAFRDGWFVTGDLGRLDDDGYLQITGRKKEILVTAGGKNVQPAVLEDALRSHPLISEVVVVGEGRPFIGALVALDGEMLPGWLRTHGLHPMSVEDAAQDPTVRAHLAAAVERANQAVSRAESIREFVVLPRELSVEAGELSASLKVRRTVVTERFAAEVERVYAGTTQD